MELNTEARMKAWALLEERIDLINTCITWDIKLGLEWVEFARNHVDVEPLDHVQDLLNEGIRRLEQGISSLRYDTGRLKNIADVINQIKTSEQAEDTENKKYTVGM